MKIGDLKLSEVIAILVIGFVVLWVSWPKVTLLKEAAPADSSAAATDGELPTVTYVPSVVTGLSPADAEKDEAG